MTNKKGFHAKNTVLRTNGVMDYRMNDTKLPYTRKSSSSNKATNQAILKAIIVLKKAMVCKCNQCSDSSVQKEKQ